MSKPACALELATLMDRGGAAVFLQIEMFVLVACPESTLMDSSVRCSLLHRRSLMGEACLMPGCICATEILRSGLHSL